MSNLVRPLPPNNSFLTLQCQYFKYIQTPPSSLEYWSSIKYSFSTYEVSMLSSRIKQINNHRHTCSQGMWHRNNRDHRDTYIKNCRYSTLIEGYIRFFYFLDVNLHQNPKHTLLSVSAKKISQFPFSAE